MDFIVELDNAVTSIVQIPFVGQMQSAANTQNFKSAVILVVGGASNLGFGEAPVFEFPTYSQEFLRQTQAAVALFFTEIVSRVAVSAGTSLSINIIDAVEYLEKYYGNSSAKTAIEMALVDLWSRQSSIGGVYALQSYLRARGLDLRSRLFDHEIMTLKGLENLELQSQGTALGSDPQNGDRRIALGDLLDKGYARVKIKVNGSWDPGEIRGLLDVKMAKARDSKLAIDANRIFRDSSDANDLMQEGIAFIESPFRQTDIKSLSQHCSKAEFDVALDEEVSSLDALVNLINFVKFDIAVLKMSRLGGITQMAKCVTLCRSTKKSFYIGGMYDSPILRRLNALFIAMVDPPEVSDLGPDSDYFNCDVPPSVVRQSSSQLSILGDFGVTGAFIPLANNVVEVKIIL